MYICRNPRHIGNFAGLTLAVSIYFPQSSSQYENSLQLLRIIGLPIKHMLGLLLSVFITSLLLLLRSLCSLHQRSSSSSISDPLSTLASITTLSQTRTDITVSTFPARPFALLFVSKIVLISTTPTVGKGLTDETGIVVEVSSYAFVAVAFICRGHADILVI